LGNPPVHTKQAVHNDPEEMFTASIHSPYMRSER